MDVYEGHRRSTFLGPVSPDDALDQAGLKAVDRRLGLCDMLLQAIEIVRYIYRMQRFVHLRTWPGNENRDGEE